MEKTEEIQKQDNAIVPKEKIDNSVVPKDETFYKVNLPNLGKHLVLDFHGVTSIDLNNYEVVNEFLLSVLDSINLKPVSQQFKQFEPQGLTSIYLLYQGHMTIHTWPEKQSCAIDFFHRLQDNWDNIRKVEEQLCEKLGWTNCTSTVIVPRGQFRRLFSNDTPYQCEILHHVKLVHREKTQFQELRIYDTKYMGRIMTLDGYVQITDGLDDNYTVDMTKEILANRKEMDHMLVIGGGDLQIANYILVNCPQVKKITVCEIDERVVANCRKFFSFSERVNKAIEEGQLNIVHEDGAAYALKLAEQNDFVDGVVVDCTDVWFEGSVSASLFTVDFYKALHASLKQGCGFSQQLSFKTMIPNFTEKWNQAGFKNIDFKESDTPEYGEMLPIGHVFKDEE